MQHPPLPQFIHAPILVLVTAMLMMQPLSTDLYLASLPSLTEVFQVPVSTIQLTLSLFVIGFGLAQLIVGPLSDRYGRRPVLLSGLALYLFASILCALANTIDLLITARFIQALGCCAAVTIARAIVRDAYPPESSAKVIARASTWISLAPIFGPILGSYLQVSFGWRAAFVALGFFSSAVFAASVMHLPETNLHKNPRATDFTGLRENYRYVLGSRVFWFYALPGAFSYGTIFLFISGSSFAFINILHVPTQWFGYCFGLGVSGYMTGTLICRRMLKSMSNMQALRIGTACAFGSGAFFFIATLLGFSHWILLVIVMFLGMASHGINFPVTQSSAVSPFPQQAGTAAGLMGALFMVFAFLIGSLVGVSHNGTLIPMAIIALILGTLIPMAIIALILGTLNFLSVRVLKVPSSHS